MTQLNFVKSELARKGQIYHTHGYTLYTKEKYENDHKIDKNKNKFYVTNKYNPDDLLTFTSLKAAYEFITEC